MFKRFAPVVCLFLLSPLVAEYLSGSLPTAMLTILPLMAAMYGSGALLIREFAVRTGGGWLSIVLLAAAYGFVEEGWVDQSLFNPDYQHLRLLDYGFVPALGTGLPWLLYVIAIHVVWSISTPIALTNAVFPGRRHVPYLNRWGIALFALLYLAANAMVTVYSANSSHFMATAGELAATGLVVAALVAAAWVVSRRKTADDERAAPAPLWLGLLGFLPGAVLTFLMYEGRNMLHLAWPVAVALQIVLAIIAVRALVTLEPRRWSNVQHISLVAGLFLVYFIGGFLTAGTMHGAADFAGHAMIALLCLAILGLAWRRMPPGHQGISLPS